MGVKTITKKIVETLFVQPDPDFDSGYELIHSFPHCCAVKVVGGFEVVDLEEGQDVDEINRDEHGLENEAQPLTEVDGLDSIPIVLATSIDAKQIELLKEAGFKEVTTVINPSTTNKVTLLMKVNTPAPAKRPARMRRPARRRR